MMASSLLVTYVWRGASLLGAFGREKQSSSESMGQWANQTLSTEGQEFAAQLALYPPACSLPYAK